MTVSKRAVEVGTGAVLFAIGVLVIVDSVRVGRGWAADGPQPGFYPFYIGLILCVAALAVVVQQFIGPQGTGKGTGKETGKAFVQAEEFRNVLAIFVPTVVYIGAIYGLGIYVASAIFLFAFMSWQGGYRLWKSLPLAIGIPAVIFLLFEIWFQVPLPKGPLEAAFGY